MQDGRWILAPEALKLLLQGSNVFSLTLDRGTWLSTQFKGHGDGCQRLVDGLNFNLISSTVNSWPDPLSEDSEDDGSVEGRLFGKRGVCLTSKHVGAPVTLICFEFGKSGEWIYR